jgi:hypothetical protein
VTSAVAVDSDGYALGVPLRSLVWDPQSAMDRALAELDGRELCGECAGVVPCDHTRYVLAPEVSDGR